MRISNTVLESTISTRMYKKVQGSTRKYYKKTENNIKFQKIPESTRKCRKKIYEITRKY